MSSFPLIFVENTTNKLRLGSCWFVLTCVGLVLTCVDSCQARVDLCWLVSDSCWFVLTRVGLVLIRVELVLIRVDSCWVVLILVYYNRLALDFLTKLCILSKCDWMNVFSTCDIIIVKQVWKCIEKVQKTSENS